MSLRHLDKIDGKKFTGTLLREECGEAGVPTRALPRHACEYRRRFAAARPAKTRADLVGSVRVRRHPHRRARSGPQSGVSRGPRAYRVRVPIKPAVTGYSASAGTKDSISAMV